MSPESRPTARRLLVAAFCGRGLVRPANEDAVGVDGRRMADEHLHIEVLSPDVDHLVIVADGMGGHAKGDVASGLAIDSLHQQWLASRQAFEPLIALQDANRSVYDSMERQPDRRGMGATVAGFHAFEGVLTWFNVGDSRVYLFRHGMLLQLTTDHVPRGDTAIGRQGRSHMVTQSLGGSFSFKDIWPALGRETLLAGDVALACSDGLTDAVPHAAIVDIFRSSSTAQDCTEQLVHAALTHGAPDNLSVVTVMW